MARPREFDPDEALEKIMRVFWRDGYEGASMQSIETATGLNKQSLYRIYPHKRAMYLAALHRYEEIEAAPAREMLLGQGSAKERVAQLFNYLVANAAKGDRQGCFLCNASTDQAQLDKETSEFLTGAMRRLEKTFREAISVSAPYKNNQEKRDAKASELLSIYFGLRLLTVANAPVRTLRAAAEQAISSI